MGELSSLFSQYSLESIILFVVAIGVAIKAISSLWEYFYDKVKNHFNLKSTKDKQYEEITDSITKIRNKIDSIEKDITETNSNLDLIKIQLGNVTERLQENTRSYIIDKHHHFVYEIGGIDDLNMQSLERRYLFYKSAGGDSYVDGLMEELRNLKKVNLAEPAIVEIIQQHEL